MSISGRAINQQIANDEEPFVRALYEAQGRERAEVSRVRKMIEDGEELPPGVTVKSRPPQVHAGSPAGIAAHPPADDLVRP